MAQKIDSLTAAVGLADIVPRFALADLPIAGLFRHYIEVLAPWYDLNDSRRFFGTAVPTRALDAPILFQAIIAFSACHFYQTTAKFPTIAPAFHVACVRNLLGVISELPESLEDYLAATCLLRSYEILNGDSRGSQRHLLGAYSFAANENIELTTWGLAQAGFWNYLREEITVGLECRRPVRISTAFPAFQADASVQDDMKANLITYILARIMNFCFEGDPELTFQAQAERVDLWQELRADLTLWTENLPSSFEPYSTAPKPGNAFPSCWMLRPWHVGALQYASVAEILLAVYNPLSIGSPTHTTVQEVSSQVQEHAMRICGLAYTNDDVAARVNAFGPISFCSRYLVREAHRDAVEAMLVAFSIPTAWPVHCIITDLKQCWSRQ